MAANPKHGYSLLSEKMKRVYGQYGAGRTFKPHLTLWQLKGKESDGVGQS